MIHFKHYKDSVTLLMYQKGNFMIIVAVVVIALLGGYALMKKGPAPAPAPVPVAETGPIKIGASLPLSGEAASYGDFTKAGIELAVKEVNDAGGVNGRKIEMAYEDDKCDSSGANAFNKLVNVDKVDAIIGPVCSAAAGPGVPVAQTGKTPTIIWASAPGLTKAGDYIFRTYPSDSFQGKYAAEYVFNTLGKKNVAVLYVKNDWGQGLHDVFTKTFTALGGKIVYEEGVAQDSTDMRTVITKAKAAKSDLIYYPMYPAGAVAGLKQMKALGVKVPVMGGDAFDTTEVTSVPEAEGVLLTFGKLNNPDEFKAKVKSVTGKEAGLFTPIGYDAVKILAFVMSEVGTDKEKVKDRLKTLSYTQGISLPKIEFDADRDLSSAEIEMRVIHNKKTETYTHTQ